MSEQEEAEKRKELLAKQQIEEAVRHAKSVAHGFAQGTANGGELLAALMGIGITAAQMFPDEPGDIAYAPIDVTIIASLETCASRIETAKTPFLKSDREEIAKELRSVIEKLS